MPQLRMAVAEGLAAQHRKKRQAKSVRLHERMFEVFWRVYSRSPKVGNPIAWILKSTAWGIPALFGRNPVSNFMGFTVL